MDSELVYPAANLHSFLFSNSFHNSPVNDIYNLSPLPKIPDSRVYCEDPYAKVSLTHGRLRSESLRLAQGIHNHFGQPEYHTNFGCSSVSGPVVLIQLPNSAALPVIAFGFLAAGWAVSTANPANTAFELSHYIELCLPRVVVTQPANFKAVQEACHLGKCDAQVFTIDVDTEWKDAEKDDDNDDSHVTKRSTSTFWTTLLSDKEFVVPPMTLAEANTRVAFILWTSGTTGKAKGAMLSHRSLVTGIVHVRVGNPTFLEHEIWAGLPPYNHVYALTNQVLIGVPIGATIVIQRKFTLPDYLALVARYKVTLLHIIPPIAVAISSSDLVHKPEYSLSSIKGILSAGAPVPPDLVRRIRDLTGVVIKSIYGMTELGPITSYKPMTWEEHQRTLASAGVPISPAIEISIVRLDGLDSTDGPSITGEIVVRSPSVMLGYIKNPEVTKEMFRSDGAHTGDIGYLDEKGFLYITGRLKELIKYKGYQVSPTELESVISDIAGVKDVAVGSIYSESQATELPMAYVVPLSNDLLRIVAANARSQSEARALNVNVSRTMLPLEALADKVERIVEGKCIYYKRLRGGIMFVSELPKSASGKVVRLALKELRGVFVDAYANRKAKL